MTAISDRHLFIYKYYYSAFLAAFLAAFLSAFFVRSYMIGVAMKIEAYVPMITPRMSATARPLIASPPKIAIASIVTRVVSEVFIVRESI